MTLSELITEVQALTGREGDTVLITSARVIRWLNEAQNKIINRCYGHLDLETKKADAIELVADTYSYDFSSISPAIHYLLHAYWIDGSASRELDYLDTDKFDEEYPSPSDLATGIPTEFTRRGSTIEIYPVPTSGEAGKYIRLDYTKKPTAFSSDDTTATCDMSDADQGLIYYAVSEAWAAVGNKEQESITWKNRFLDWLESYRAEKDSLYMIECNNLLNR